MMPSNSRIMAFVTALALVSVALCGSLPADDRALVHLDRLIASDELDQAALLARELDDQEDPGLDLTLSLARLARALQQQDDVPAAAEFYQRSVNASKRPGAAALAPNTVVLVRLAAASVLTQDRQLSDALAAVTTVLADNSGASPSQKQIAVSILLKIGASGLSTGAASTSAEAYSIALEHADRQQMATAMLGDAWSTAILRDRPLQAANKLAAFVDRYPDHEDAARAARACAECFKQARRTDDASKMLSELLERWPDAEPTLEVIRSHQDLAPDLVPESTCNWMMNKAKSNDLSAFDAKLTVLGIQIAGNRRHLEAWSNLARHLASIDESGQATSDLLSALVEDQKEADAEQLATQLIAPSEDADVTAKAREAACRWAGRTMRWSMLALASESETPSEANETRTLTVERLMAEALMQTGQTPKALLWWNHIVDHHAAGDFSTLVRCAEAETSSGRDAAVAQRRIAAAREAAGGDRFRLALVNLLDAELSIRRSKFDHARALLESVVRESDTEATLRGRAQWLIGETHYLQQDFTKAIEAYRRVEGMDPDGIWLPASLIQAGKSFEQMGRMREASVCYGHLLSRFADTSHAEAARQRMAAMSPSDQGSNNGNHKNPLSEKPIRR